MTDFRETPGTPEDVAARAADSMAFLSDVERKAREACNYEVSDAYQNAWLVIRDQRATIERLERERDEAKAISQGWELQAGEAEAEVRDLVESAHRSLLRLITDYEDVPDATDADGQAVFAEAREVAGRLWCFRVEWRHLRWFKRWAYWSEKGTWI